MKSTYRTILPLVLAAAALATTSQVLAEAISLASLMQVQGLVKLRPSGGAWHQAVLPQNRYLWPRDELQTHQHSRARVGLDGATLELGPLTHIVIPATRAQKPTARTLLQVLKGKLLILLIGARPIEIGTAGATASARGTKFLVDVDDAGVTVLTVLEGSVDFYNDLGTVLVAAGEQSTAGPGQAPSRPMRVDPSTLIDWEASPDAIWLGFEKLYHPELTAEQRLGMLPKAEADALRNPAARSLLPEYMAWGDLLSDCGRYAEAEAAYQGATAFGTPDALTLKLAFAKLAQGRNQEAADLFAQAAKLPALKGVALAGQAIAALGTGGDALGLAGQALAAAPQDAEAAVMAGFVYLRAGTLEQALTTLQKAATLNPREYRAPAYLSLAKLASGDGPAACDLAAAAVSAAPGSGLAHASLGTAAFYAGSLEQAAAEAALAQDLAPDSATAHLLSAQVAAAQGNLPLALREAELAVALDPSLAQAYQTLGVLSLALNDVPRAEKSFRKALDLQPKLGTAMTGLGQALARQDRMPEALQAQQAAISLDPAAAGAHNNLGAVYMQTGKLNEALAEYDKALELQPNWALVHGNRALTYLEMNQYAKAVAEGELAVKLGARSARVHTTLARVYLKQNRVNRAWAALREALQLDPNYALARMHMAEVYQKLGLSDEANRERLQAMTRQPSVMVDNRGYGRSELTLRGGGGPTADASAFTSGRGDSGQNAFYVAGRVTDGDWDRPRTDYTNRAGLAYVGRQTSPDHTVLMVGEIHRDDLEVPGPALPGGLGLPTDLDYERQARGAEFQVLTRSPLDDMQLTWRGGYRWNYQRDTNPDSLLPDPNPLAQLKLTQEGPMLEARLDKQLSSGAALLAGVAWHQQQTSVSGVLTTVNFTPPPAVVYTPFANRYTRDLVTGYADWEKRLDDRLWLLVGGRVAVASDANPVLLPRVRLRYKPSTDSTFVLLTRPVLADNAAELAPQDEWASRSFGSPVVLDRGGYNQSYELQYELQPSDGSSLRLTAFHRDLRNLMVSLEDPAWAVGAARPELGKASVQGVEAEYERWLTSRLSGGVWVRWAQSDNRDPGFPAVPYEPSLRAQARLDYLDDAGWRVALIWNHVGRRWADLANTNRLGAFDTLDFSIARQFDLHTDAFIAVENLMDEEYEYYQGYPERGRRAYAGFRYRF